MQRTGQQRRFAPLLGQPLMHDVQQFSCKSSLFVFRIFCDIVGASRKPDLSLKVQISGSNKHLMISIQCTSSGKSEIASVDATSQ